MEGETIPLVHPARSSVMGPFEFFKRTHYPLFIFNNVHYAVRGAVALQETGKAARHYGTGHEAELCAKGICRRHVTGLDPRDVKQGYAGYALREAGKAAERYAIGGRIYMWCERREWVSDFCIGNFMQGSGVKQSCE
jgi:hypothetical protein